MQAPSSQHPTRCRLTTLLRHVEQVESNWAGGRNQIQISCWRGQRIVHIVLWAFWFRVSWNCKNGFRKTRTNRNWKIQSTHKSLFKPIASNSVVRSRNFDQRAEANKYWGKCWSLLLNKNWNPNMNSSKSIVLSSRLLGLCNENDKFSLKWWQPRTYPHQPPQFFSQHTPFHLWTRVCWRWSPGRIWEQAIQQPCDKKLMGRYMELQFRQNAIFVTVDRGEILLGEISLFVTEEAYCFLHSFFFALFLSFRAFLVEVNEVRRSPLQVVELHFGK